jgi:integral membrane protein
VSGLFKAYRVLATVVGVLLIPLFSAWGLQLLGSGSAEDLGHDMTAVLGPLHGLLYMLFFFSAVLLARRADWDLGFTVVTLLLGTIVFASFWAERRAAERVRADFPELAPA